MRISSKVYGAKLSSTLEDRSSCFNVTLVEDSSKYIAFTTRYGKYKFRHIPFGNHIAPRYFAMVISETLKY